jgi:hypothetical protein
VQITYSSTLKSPNHSRASLVRYSLHKLNKIYDRQHPLVTPISIFTFVFSPWLSLILTVWSIYSLLINVLSHQSRPFLFRICNHVVHFSWSNAFCQSMKQACNISSVSNIHPVIILSNPLAFLVSCKPSMVDKCMGLVQLCEHIKM